MQLYQTLTKGILIFIDELRTRHVLAAQLSLLSNRNCHALGKVRLNNIDDHDKPAVEKAVYVLKIAERDKWLLSRVQNASTERTEGTFVDNCGYLAFKNSLAMSFYTNKHSDTLLLRIHGADEHATGCVHGLAPL